MTKEIPRRELLRLAGWAGVALAAGFTGKEIALAQEGDPELTNKEAIDLMMQVITVLISQIEKHETDLVTLFEANDDNLQRDLADLEDGNEIRRELNMPTLEIVDGHKVEVPPVVPAKKGTRA